MTNYCRTDVPAGDTYIEKWQGGSANSECRRFVDYNACQQAQYVSTVDGLARRYLITDANPITYAQQGSLVYDPRIETVIQTCQDYPGGCDDVLTQVCSGYSRQDLGANPNLAKLCGCFMSDAQYDSYTGAFGVSKICDPACVLQSAIKPRDPSNQCVTSSCGQTICVMDNITIDILNKSSTGDITFGQACSACTGGAGCTCNISDISITSVESQIGDINFNQQCGTVNCYKSDANGVPQLVTCEQGSTGGGSGSGTGFLSSNVIFFIIVGIVILIVLLIIIVLLASRNKTVIAPYRGENYGAAPPPLYGGSYASYPTSPLSRAAVI